MRRLNSEGVNLFLKAIVDKLRLLPICQEHYSMNFGQFQSKICRYDVDKDIVIGCPPLFLPNDTVGMSMKSQFTMNSCALGPKMELEIDS